MCSDVVMWTRRKIFGQLHESKSDQILVWKYLNDTEEETDDSGNRRMRARDQPNPKPPSPLDPAGVVKLLTRPKGT